jgi:hypothetical protein
MKQQRNMRIAKPVLHLKSDKMEYAGDIKLLSPEMSKLMEAYLQNSHENQRATSQQQSRRNAAMNQWVRIFNGPISPLSQEDGKKDREAITDTKRLLEEVLSNEGKRTNPVLV